MVDGRGWGAWTCRCAQCEEAFLESGYCTPVNLGRVLDTKEDDSYVVLFVYLVLSSATALGNACWV